MRWARTLGVAALAVGLGASTASGYYHFWRLTDDGRQLPERFDQAALLDGAVRFYLSAEQRPRLESNDSFEGVVSQVRQALAAWDAAPTSSLRVGFGGVLDGPLNGSTPAGEIIFAELPPGVIGFGGPVMRGEPRDGFVPILRSQVIISENLVDRSRPRQSFSEAFFNALVHEIGHALGLQHTLSGSAMSMEATRWTTRAQPLGPDDLAGLSVLYPTDDFVELTGGLGGRVTFTDGSGVSMASVAAVGAGGQVITALTRSDGRYRIDGLQAGRYLVYVQPLPPATSNGLIGGLGPANIVLPTDSVGAALEVSAPFRAIFHGGSDQPDAAVPVAVRVGSAAAGIDFRVERRRDTPFTAITTFSFPGNGAPGVHPAFLNLSEEPGLLVATGGGLTEAVGSLRVEPLLRDIGVRTPRIYEFDDRFLRLDLEAAPFEPAGPLHLVFRLPDDFYVLPGAAQLTGQPAPVIHWIWPDYSRSDGALRVRGDGFDPGSAVYFDGLPALATEFDEIYNELVVVPPHGPPGHRAIVTVYNSDGQSSAFTLPDGNVVLEYPDAPKSRVRVSPSSAQPDSDLVVNLNGEFTTFEAGATTIGFGSSDIVTRAVEVLDGGRARAVVSVAAGAAPGDYSVSVVNGLETITLDGAFRVEEDAESRSTPQLRFGGLLNSATNTPDVSPGTLASLFGTNLALTDGAGVRVTFDGEPARILAATPEQINLQIPPNARPGTVEVRVYNGRAESAPMLADLSRAAPGLFPVMSSDAAAAGFSRPAAPGGIFELLATGLSGSSDAEGLGMGLTAVVGGIRTTPVVVSEVSGSPGLYSIRIRIPLRLSGRDAADVFVVVEGRQSNTITLPLAPAAS